MFNLTKFIEALNNKGVKALIPLFIFPFGYLKEYMM